MRRVLEILALGTLLAVGLGLLDVAVPAQVERRLAQVVQVPMGDGGQSLIARVAK